MKIHVPNNMKDYINDLVKQGYIIQKDMTSEFIKKKALTDKKVKHYVTLVKN
jgi:hypothetical protein